MTQLAEDTPIRLVRPVVARTLRGRRTVELPAGTVGAVLLGGGGSYEIEVVLPPADPDDWAATDYVICSVENDVIEPLPRSEWSRA